MKKFTLFLGALLCITTLSARTLYLVPNDNWKQANAKFAANYFGGEGVTQAFTDFLTSEDGIHYVAEIPDAATTVIFTRHAADAATPSWENKWNQTGDITIPADNNCYTIADGAWDNGEGTWSTFDPATVEPMTYYVTGNEALVGAELVWNVQAIAMTGTPATYTFTNLTPGVACEMKITSGTWNPSWGYEALDTESSSANITNVSGNIAFTPTEATATVTFDGTKITLTGTFLAPEPVKDVTLYFLNKDNWTAIFAYVFEGAGGGFYKVWPGEEMTKTEELINAYEVYSYTFPETYNTIIFHNNAGTQTDDLVWNAEKPYFFGDKWYTKEEIEKETTTGISEVPALSIDAPMYNVLGQQVDASFRGVVLQNGHKYIR